MSATYIAQNDLSPLKRSQEAKKSLPTENIHTPTPPRHTPHPPTHKTYGPVLKPSYFFIDISSNQSNVVVKNIPHYPFLRHYWVSHNEVIKMTSYCSKSKHNLIIPVFWTQFCILLDPYSKYQQNSLIITYNVSDCSTIWHNIYNDSKYSFTLIQIH